MKRQSLSASLGAWYFQLGYNPAASAPRGEAGQALLFFPAYAAILVGVGAGCFALAHFINLGPLTSYLLAGLFASVLISYGARCAPERLRRFCAALRWPLIVLMLLFAVSARFNSLLPPDSEAEGNSIVAVLVGMVTVMSVLLVGARSGQRLVPLSAPLVPGLSLFGLLCLISVDAEIEIGFLLFVASALYLLAYERLIQRFLNSNGELDVSGSISRPSAEVLWRWMAQCLLVCSVWFGTFMVGGMLFYYPVQALLPRFLTPQINKLRNAAQGTLLDYRGSSTVMELRGGDYVLSDREVMKITVRSGEPSGLWRGRIYDNYTRSRWEESDASGHPNGGDHSLFHSGGPNPPKLPPINPTLGRERIVMENVEPLDGGAGTLFASGQLISYHDATNMEDTSGGGGDYARSRAPYLIKSRVVTPAPSKLLKVAGLPAATLKNLHQDSPLISALALPDDEASQRTLKAIAQQIILGQRHRPVTPYQKVRAIAGYLVQNCAYSLRSPEVPPTEDGVIYFLTKSRSGACDMFASSMALLLRTMNVPSRVATGYLQPEQSQGEIEHTADGRSTWLLRERDAHAWVEYYVPGLDWLSYDPTAGTRQAPDTLPSQLAQMLDLPALNISPQLLVLPMLGLALLGAGLLWSVWERRAGTPEPRDAAFMERARIFAAYECSRRLLSRRVPRGRHQTPDEYEALVSRAPASLISLAAKQEFAALTHLYIAAQYAPAPPKLADGELEKCVRRLKNGL